jgi:hypothetical protein
MADWLSRLPCVTYGPLGFMREPTDEERAKDVAIATVIEWFDMNKMAEGLRAFYRDDRHREHRARAMKANPPKYARWWNR